MTFPDLGLSAPLLQALEKQGLSEPTPIQVQALPVIREGKDVFVCAETGSGKTLAYLLPLYDRLVVQREATQVVILAPTHELALQIHRVSCDLAQAAGLAVRNVLLLGGTAVDRQIDKLKKKPQIVIGTPGRTLELIERGKVKLQELKTLVFDEADRLLSGESLEMMLEIVAAAPKGRQLVFVSATDQSESNLEIAQLSPELVRLQGESTPVNPNIDHYYTVLEERDKPELLRKFIHATKTERAIVFVHRNEAAEIIADKLEHHKIAVADLHGAYDKEDRQQAMRDFRSGKATVLIASDLAARGLDFSGVTHVFNLDIPSKSKDYLHRVGRAGRAGARGVAISFVVASELPLIRRLKRDLGIEVAEVGVRGGDVIEVGT